jgi:hypothetical protein
MVTTTGRHELRPYSGRSSFKMLPMNLNRNPSSSRSRNPNRNHNRNPSKDLPSKLK